MKEEEKHYIESKLDLAVKREDNVVSYVFQRTKLKMVDELEINMLKSIHRQLQKKIEVTEDELIISFELPNNYHYFERVFTKSNRERYRFAFNVIDEIESHTYSRLFMTISPENIIFDEGLRPTFLHYGVSESVPPYETNQEEEWLETRALIAYIVDNSHDFSTYVNHYKTLELKGIAKEVMFAKDFFVLKEILARKIERDTKAEETVVSLPKSKFKWLRGALWGLVILLIPALTYSFYILFFKMPEMEAYVASNEHYLKNDYSSVIDELQQLNGDRMPQVIQYELAMSYIANESLSEEQKRNILNSMTLQSDRNYYLYWIHLGRGNYEESVDIATYLEDRDLILLGLIRLEESVRIDESLSSDERKEQIKNIEREIDDYKREIEEELKQAEEEATEENDEEENVEDGVDEEDKDDKKEKKKSKKD